MLYRNKNWLALICGETGSGKSLSAIKMANLISPRGITIKRNLVFTPQEFLNKIKNKQNFEPADVLIFDEAGIGLSARDWYSIQNKLLGAVLQAFRHLNIGLIFTTPDLSFIDVQARRLFHNYFETITINHKENLCYLSVYNVQRSSRYGVTFYKHPKYNWYGDETTLEVINLHLPDQELIEDYEEAKEHFTTDLYTSASKDLEIKTQKKDSVDKFKEDQKIIKDLKKNYKSYIKEYHKIKYLDKDLIRADYDISTHRAEKIKKIIERDLSIN